MPAGAQLSVPELRRSSRHPVDHHVVAEHLTLGEMPLHIRNLSAHGFMVDDCSALDRGHRVIVPLPVIGRIEAYCVWTKDRRAGLHFERIIRADDLEAMIAVMRAAGALDARAPRRA